MRKVFIPGTRRTPEVHLKDGLIRFSGRSVPADPGYFYQPLYDWIEEYSQKKIKQTKIELDFEYINTASTKWVFNLISLLGNMPDLANKLEITWFYEEGDDDMAELGNIFKSLIPVKFTLIKTSEVR
jgi:hypothetical protein